MVWNAAGTFHTRLSATALTANRKFVFPDLDGTFVVASAGVVSVDRISASSVFATVLTATTAHINQLSSSLVVALLGNINFLSASGITVVVLSADSSSLLNPRLRRGDANAEGGQIDWDRPFDGATQMAIDLIGSGTATANISMRWLNTNPGVVLMTLGLDGTLAPLRFSTSAIVATRADINGASLSGALIGVLSSTNIFSSRADINSGSFSGALITVLSASALGVTGAVAIGGTLTVSGTTVLADLTVAGRISASAGNVVGTLSAGRVDVANGLLVVHRQNTTTEGGEIELTRPLDDTVEFIIDDIGSSSTVGILRMFENVTPFVFYQYNRGLQLHQFDGANVLFNIATVEMRGLLSVSGTAVVGQAILLGGATAVAPYNVVGSIVSTAGAACQFKNTLKSWCRFTGTAGGLTIGDSFNISSVTRASSGRYQVVFQNSIINTNYGQQAFANSPGGAGNSTEVIVIASGSYEVAVRDLAANFMDGTIVSTSTYNGAG